MTEDEKLEFLKARFKAAEEEERNGELTDADALFELLDAEDALLDRVRPWFYSDADTLAWFNELIPSFGMTPAELVKQYGAKGVEALSEYITSKEQGGFE